MVEKIVACLRNYRHSDNCIFNCDRSHLTARTIYSSNFDYFIHIKIVEKAIIYSFPDTFGDYGIFLSIISCFFADFCPFSVYSEIISFFVSKSPKFHDFLENLLYFFHILQNELTY